MTKRKGISKKLRFSVFERDDFTCQYCGKNPSDYDIVLNVDHAISVYDDGLHEIDNFVTSCWDCNIGKGKKSVIKNIKPKEDLEQQLKNTKERLEQIKSMNKAMKEIDNIKNKIDDEKYLWINNALDGFKEDFINKVKALIKKEEGKGVDIDILKESFEIANKKFLQEEFYTSDYLKYIHGVKRNKILERDDPQGAAEKKQRTDLYYFACNTFDYVNSRYFYSICDNYDLEWVEDSIKNSRNWTQFKNNFEQNG